MGMKDWLDKVKKSAEEKLKPEPTDPESVRKRKKEEAEKAFKLTTEAIKLAKKGVGIYKDTSKKIEDVTKDVAEKTVVLADKAKPIAEKVDSTTDALTDKVKGAFGKAGEKSNDNNAGTGEPETPETADGKGIDLAGKTKDALDATRGAISAGSDAAGKIGGKIFDAAKGAFDSAGKKVDDMREDAAKKPSTGSTLLDLLAPAIPETDGTKPKKDADKPKTPEA